MSTYRPAGMLLFPEALGRAMRTWAPEAWDRLPDDARSYLDGGAELRGFALTNLPRQPCVKECYDRLRHMLASGFLPSRLRVGNGVVPLAPSAWNGRDANRLSDVLIGRVRFAGCDSTGDTLLVADELEAVFAGRAVPQPGTIPDSEPIAKPASEQSLPKRRGGRPPKAGSDDFWIEAARLVYTGQAGASGQTQQAFIDAMLSWTQQHQGADAYGEDAVESKIKKLWRALKLGR